MENLTLEYAIERGIIRLVAFGNITPGSVECKFIGPGGIQYKDETGWITIDSGYSGSGPENETALLDAWKNARPTIVSIIDRYHRHVNLDSSPSAS